MSDPTGKFETVQLLSVLSVTADSLMRCLPSAVDDSLLDNITSNIWNAPPQVPLQIVPVAPAVWTGPGGGTTFPVKFRVYDPGHSGWIIQHIKDDWSKCTWSSGAPVYRSMEYWEAWQYDASGRVCGGPIYRTPPNGPATPDDVFQYPTWAGISGTIDVWRETIAVRDYPFREAMWQATLPRFPAGFPVTLMEPKFWGLYVPQKHELHQHITWSTTSWQAPITTIPA